MKKEIKDILRDLIKDNSLQWQCFIWGCIIVFIILGCKKCYGYRSEVRSLLRQSSPAFKDWNEWSFAEYSEEQKTKWRKRDILVSGIIKSNTPLFTAVKHLSGKPPLPDFLFFEEFNGLKQGVGFYAEIHKGYSKQNLLHWSGELPVFFTKSKLSELEKSAVVVINNEPKKDSLKNMAAFEKYLKEMNLRLPEFLNNGEKVYSVFLEDMITYRKISVWDLNEKDRALFFDKYDKKISDVDQVISRIDADLMIIHNCFDFPLADIYGSDKYVVLLKDWRQKIQRLRDKMKMQYDNFKAIHILNKNRNRDIQSGKYRIVKPKSANF